MATITSPSNQQVPIVSTPVLQPWASPDEIALQIAHDMQCNVHYDVPAAAFRYILGPAMKYSTGLWDADHVTLEAAQEANLAQITESLHLTGDSHILDVGCGWGAFAIFAAKHTGCRVTGIALSPQQIEYARAWARAEGVDHLTEFRAGHILALPDPPGTFSHAVFLEVLEHLRLRRETIASCRRVMRPNGLLYIQFLGVRSLSYRAKVLSNPGSQHIFHIFGDVGDPVPLSTALLAFEENDFEVLTVHNISGHYPATLRAWMENIREHRAAIDALTTPGWAESLRKYFMLCLTGYHKHLGTDYQIWGRLLPALGT